MTATQKIRVDNERLAERRRERLAGIIRGMYGTLTDAAESLGVSRQKIQNYCSRHDPIRIEAVQFVRLAAACGMSSDRLMDELLKA